MAGLDLKTVEQRAIQLSQEFRHYFLGTEHVFLAVLVDEPYLADVLARYKLTAKAVTDAVLKIAERGDGDAPWKGVPQTQRLVRIKQLAEREARDAGATGVESQHVIAAILREGRGIPARVLESLNVDLLALRGEVLSAGSDRDSTGGAPASPAAEAARAARRMEGPEGMAGMADIVGSEPSSDRRRKPEASSEATEKKPRTAKKSPLSDYARELTSLARENKLEPVIGRADEIRRCLQILTRKGKNNPVLIGEAGVGKSSVVYGLAQRIAEGRVPDAVKEKEVWELSITRLVAGAAYRGEFQERLQKLMDEVLERPNVILFIDEIHMLMGAGDHKGGMDAGNILKPALARGEFPVIGATTTDEYRRSIETDPALERRFQPVLVNEPSDRECLQILEGLRPRYETHHGIKISDHALKAAVKLSTRYLPDRSLPDKAIDLIDEASARVKLSASSKSIILDGPPSFEVREEDIAEVVSHWSGVPVTQLTVEESERLRNIEQSLRGRVIGQDDAIRVVAQTIRVMRMGLGNEGRPAGVFLFAGPTGVGKTELARALAEFLFGSEKDLIRLDMSEFMEKHMVARLIGPPPGYVGFEDEGQLTGAVRKKPYSVVLLDEIEKAHPDVFDLFLQVFDDGRLTDSRGRTINFTNTLIIMTSNIGTRPDIVADPDDPTQVEYLETELRKRFRLEFLNRIDDRLLFRSLGPASLERIIDLQIGEFARRLRERRGVMLAVGADARRLLLEKGYSPSLGARPLKRAIDSMLVKPLAEVMLGGEYRAGDLITVKTRDGKIAFAKEDFDHEEEDEPAPDASTRPSAPSPPPAPAARPEPAPAPRGTSTPRVPQGASLRGSGERRATARGATERVAGSAQTPAEERRATSAAPTAPTADPNRDFSEAPRAPRNLGGTLDAIASARRRQRDDAPDARSLDDDDDDLRATLPRARPDPADLRRPRKSPPSDDGVWGEHGDDD